MKSTIKIADLKEKINGMILHSNDAHKEGRVALSVCLESILHETENYMGFSYLTEGDMKKSQNGSIPGIVDGEKPGQFNFPDETRRKYH